MLCEIFQTDANWRFFGYDFAKGHGYSPEEYHLVYDCDVDDDYTPEDAFYDFNMNYPDDYEGRSLSVSDIVVLDGAGYYCDSIGFVELPDSECPSASNY